MTNDDSASDNAGGEGARARRILTEISPAAWEHPADKAALQALRRIPVFDDILRKIFGAMTEKSVRLAFQASAVRVTERQFPHIHESYQECLRTLDAPRAYPLYVSQTPQVNAGAWGMKEPFIILNSGTVRLLDDDELAYVMGHEIGHIMSDHVLYKTMTVLLLGLASLGFPIVGLAARAVLVGLLEWQRKSELSSDRAGLLTVQDPDLVLRTMLKMAGGGQDDELNLADYVKQAEDYREGGDMLDQVFKVLNLVGQTHPFYTIRVNELRTWVEMGEYDRVIRGEYLRRGEPSPEYQEDVRAAADSYREGAREWVDTMKNAARRMTDNVRSGMSR
ncbi:MAG: M48 family metallopeptidase [Gemmatimonadetes bacterium]|nr:M48 family metallopeptidase [Gemmatimonadota bacterium]